MPHKLKYDGTDIEDIKAFMDMITGKPYIIKLIGL